MVEELIMNFVNLSSSGAIKLFTSKAKKLRILGINSNNITDEACDVIIMAMKKNTSLVRLDMCTTHCSSTPVQQHITRNMA